MLNEIKFIIIKDKAGRLHHLKSEWLHHYTIARDNGYDTRQILEAGLFLDNQLYILECENLEHLKKHSREYIGNRLNFYHDLKLQKWLRGRELESQVYYKQKPVGLREGD